MSFLDKLVKGDDALQKFAFSLLVVKGMTRKHPYLKPVA